MLGGEAGECLVAEVGEFGDGLVGAGEVVLSAAISAPRLKAARNGPERRCAVTAVRLVRAVGWAVPAASTLRPVEVDQPPRRTIDLAAAPLPRRTLAQVKIDEEAVVYSPETGCTCDLNAVATAVWTCLDGRTTLRELAEDIAAVAGWDLRRVEAELVELVRGFGNQGLLAGVDPGSARAAVADRVWLDRRSPRFVPVPPEG